MVQSTDDSESNLLSMEYIIFISREIAETIKLLTSLKHTVWLYILLLRVPLHRQSCKIKTTLRPSIVPSLSSSKKHASSLQRIATDNSESNCTRLHPSSLRTSASHWISSKQKRPWPLLHHHYHLAIVVVSSVSLTAIWTGNVTTLILPSSPHSI